MNKNGKRRSAASKPSLKSPVRHVLIMHGPNLNLLGEREPEVYGTMTLPELNAKLRGAARKLGVTLRFFQANGEGELLDWLHAQRKWADALVINPGAFTHYSYALRDGIVAMPFPAVEVHLSDIQRREAFRRVSVIRDVCVAQFAGLGWKSYLEGLRLVCS